MLDIKFIRENKDLVKQGAEKKHIPFDVEALIAIDDKRLGMLSQVEALRFEQNQMSNKMSGVKDTGMRVQMNEEMKILKEDLKTKEDELREILKEWQLLMLQVPNIPDMTVPEGESGTQGQVF